MQFRTHNNYEITELIAQQPSSSPAPQINKSTRTNVQSDDPITIIIALFSLLVSIAVAYTSNFRKANLKLSLGRNIIFFPTYITVPTGNKNIVGLGFNLPITFYNWSPQGGTIQRIRLVVGRKDNDNFYDMAWTTFVKIESAGNFQDENLAQPIPVQARSSVNKIVRFDWSPELGGKEFDLQVGNYELRIYGWTQNTQKPDLKYMASFNLKDQHYQQYKDNIAANLTESIWVSLDENEKPNQFVSKHTIGVLYSKK
ncbi:MAG: hypothetical protein F6K53_15340 [Moorea sp. SIO4A1]|nr:hypothetical protein [Moorena sp. SIO4A1]